MSGGSLFFDIFGRDKGVGKVFDDIHGKAEGLGGTFGKVSAGAGRLVAPLAALFAADKIKDFGIASVAAFSELEDSSAAAGVVFGDSMTKVIEQSKTAGASLGLSSQQVINAANTFGTYGKAAGLGGDDLASFSTDLTALAGDMASFKGTSTEQAIEAVGAALRGEAEPIRAYGVMMDDASLKDEAMRQGIIKTTKDALTPQQKILAAQGLIFAQAKDAQGDFARTSQSTANVAKTLAAENENLAAKTGTLLAPAFTAVRLKALDGVRGMSGFLDKLIDVQGVVADGGNGFAIADALGFKGDTAATIGGILDETRGSYLAFFAGLREGGENTSAGVSGAFEGAGIALHNTFTEMKGSGLAFFAAFKAGDGDITSSGMAGTFERLGFFGRQLWDAISPLIPTVIQLYQQFSPLSMLFQVLGPLIPMLAQQLGEIATVAGATLMPFLQSLTPLVAGVLTAIMSMVPALIPVIQAVMDAFFQLVPAIMPLIGMALPLITSLIPPVLAALGALIPLIVSIIQIAIVPLVQMLGDILPPIINALIPIVTTVFGMIASIITSVLQIVTGVINTVMAIIAGDWGAAWNGILQILAGIGNLVIGIVTGLGTMLWQVISGAMQVIGAVWSAGWNFVGSVLSGVFGGILRGAGDMIGSLLGFFADLPGKILGFWNGVGSWLYNVGRDLINGLLNGAGSLLRNVGSFFADMLPEMIRGPFKQALGIASPSKEFDGYGQNLGEGVINGADKMQSRLDARMSRLVSVPDLPDVGLGQTGSARGTSAGQSFVEKLDALLELLRSQRPVAVHAAEGQSEVLVGRAIAEQLDWKG